MKLQLTVLVLLITTFAFSQDTSYQSRYRKNAIAALKAQESQEQKPQSIKIRNDTAKGWRALVGKPLEEKNWWGYTKDIIAGIWKDKPWLLLLGGIFLLMGIWKLGRRMID